MTQKVSRKTARRIMEYAEERAPKKGPGARCVWRGKIDRGFD